MNGSIYVKHCKTKLNEWNDKHMNAWHVGRGRAGMRWDLKWQQDREAARWAGHGGATDRGMTGGGAKKAVGQRHRCLGFGLWIEKKARYGVLGPTKKV